MDLILFAVLVIQIQMIGTISSKCGYKGCHPTRDNMLNVHLVPHTHLDTGWLYTYDSYYFTDVQRIYDSVIEALSQNEKRRFTAVEISFFSRWYLDSNVPTREKVRNLVNSGQLDFTSGGWSMADEATTYYTHIIDDMTLGHLWLNETFGPNCGRPTAGWQIDPFGHSIEFASLLRQAGFDGLIHGRGDTEELHQRKKNKSMEMLWRTSSSEVESGNLGYLFTSFLYDKYYPPAGFNFHPYMGDISLKYRGSTSIWVSDFVKLSRMRAKSYRTNHLLIPMGNDIQYQNAEYEFNQLDQLIEEVNKLSASHGVYILYSTPKCYLKAVNKAKPNSWIVKTEDFFPYIDHKKVHDFWTGYFTSRPTLKYQIRQAQSLLQFGKQLSSFGVAKKSTLTAGSIRNLGPLKDWMGIMAHHDAITGTSKQQVVNDFSLKLIDSAKYARKSISKSYANLLSDSVMTGTDWSWCEKLNVSECSATEELNMSNGPLLLRIYNPYSHNVTHPIRLPVKYSYRKSYRISDSAGKQLWAQIVPLHPAVRKLPERHSSAVNELIFMASLPPMGYDHFHVTQIEYPHNLKSKDDNNIEATNEIRIGKTMQVIFDKDSGLLQRIEIHEPLLRPRKISLYQNFMYYEARGHNGRAGAYKMSVLANAPTRISNKAAIIRVSHGPVVDEVHQVFNEWASQTVRVYHNGDPYVEFDWIVGPLPVLFGGIEFITRFYSKGFRNNATWYTDSNGRQTVKRVRDFRSSWNYTPESDKVASNYYPITSWIYMRDESKDLQLSLLPDRPVGGSSMVDGSLEMLLHRKLMNDDALGMGEPLNERDSQGRGIVVRGKHILMLDSIRSSSERLKTLTREMSWQPDITFGGPENLKTKSKKWSCLNKDIPKQVHIPTLEPIVDTFKLSSYQYGGSASRLLLRLEHIYEANDSPLVSKPINIKLNSLFTCFNITDVTETILTGIKDLSSYELEKLTWRPEVSNNSTFFNEIGIIDKKGFHKKGGDGFTVDLRPMDLRTFILKVN